MPFRTGRSIRTAALQFCYNVVEDEEGSAVLTHVALGPLDDERHLPDSKRSFRPLWVQICQDRPDWLLHNRPNISFSSDWFWFSLSFFWALCWIPSIGYQPFAGQIQWWGCHLKPLNRPSKGWKDQERLELQRSGLLRPNPCLCSLLRVLTVQLSKPRTCARFTYGSCLESRQGLARPNKIAKGGNNWSLTWTETDIITIKSHQYASESTVSKAIKQRKLPNCRTRAKWSHQR
jgi:hypothetical protein